MNCNSCLTDSQWQFIDKIFGDKEMERKHNHCRMENESPTSFFVSLKFLIQ